MRAKEGKEENPTPLISILQILLRRRRKQCGRALGA